MRRWLYDNPWIWIVVLLGSVVASSLVLVVIAELNRPEIVREKKEQPAPQDTALAPGPAAETVGADLTGRPRFIPS